MVRFVRMSSHNEIIERRVFEFDHTFIDEINYD